MATVVDGDFEWNDGKAIQNLKKHGVSFEEAVGSVLDPNAIVREDDSHREERFQIIGCSSKARILLVVTVERGDRDRIISARQATPEEERSYFSKT